nr:MAG TPA: hypothetical protein [Caudoviricetes sp.]
MGGIITHRVYPPGNTLRAIIFIGKHISLEYRIAFSILI